MKKQACVALLCCVILFIPKLSLGISALLATIVQAYCAAPLYKALFKKEGWRRELLVVLGISIAYLVCLFQNNFQLSVFAITSILIGRTMEEYLMAKIQKIPLLENKGEINRGDRLMVSPQTILSVDGRIIEGSLALDPLRIFNQSSIVEKQPGELVYAGSFIHEGTALIEVMRVGPDTLLAQMAQVMQSPVHSRASDLLLFVTLLSAPWLGLPLLLGSAPALFLVSRSATLLFGLSAAIQKGIYFKDGSALEKLSKLKELVFEKPVLVRMREQNVEKIELDDRYLPIVKTLCENGIGYASHSLLSHLKRGSVLSLPLMLAFRPDKEHGVSGYFDGRKYLLGSLNYLQGQDTPIHELAEATEPEIGRVIGFGTDQVSLGYFVLTDSLKPESRELIQRLKGWKVATYLETDDEEKVAQQLADKLDMDFFGQYLNPKWKRVKEAEGFEVEVAGLVESDLKNLLPAFAIARCVQQKNRQNCIFAWGYHALIFLFSGIGLLNPFVSAALMPATFLFVRMNASQIDKCLTRLSSDNNKDKRRKKDS